MVDIGFKEIKTELKTKIENDDIVTISQLAGELSDRYPEPAKTVLYKTVIMGYNNYVIENPNITEKEGMLWVINQLNPVDESSNIEFKNWIYPFGELDNMSFELPDLLGIRSAAKEVSETMEWFKENWWKLIIVITIAIIIIVAFVYILIIEPKSTQMMQMVMAMSG